MAIKDPADVLRLDLMFGIIEDSKNLPRHTVEEKYTGKVDKKNRWYLRRYLDRIYP